MHLSLFTLICLHVRLGQEYAKRPTLLRTAASISRPCLGQMAIKMHTRWFYTNLNCLMSLMFNESRYRYDLFCQCARVIILVSGKIF